MSGIVESCPGNSTGFAEASSRLNCSRDQYGNDQYICVPNVNKTALVEFCYGGIMGIRQRGNCLEVSERELFKRNCTGFVDGCPETHIRIGTIYKYPACLRINTDYKCYLADPSCPNKTREFTTEDTWGSPTTSFGTTFSNTTETYDSTTLPTNAVPVGAIVGVLLAFHVIIGIVIGFVVWKRRKKWKRTGTIIVILCINKRKKWMRTGTIIVMIFNKTTEVTVSCFVLEWKKRKLERKMKILGDCSDWKTKISDQFSSLSDDEECVLFCFLCPDSGTPDFTDADCLDILNVIRYDVYYKDRVTSEEAQRTLDGLNSRGFLWDQDGVDITEDAKDETMYRVTERRIERVIVRSVSLLPVYQFSSYTTAVRYLRSQRYTRKSGEKCVISVGPNCDPLLIRRLQMNILTHVTMEDTRFCDEVSQTLCIPQGIFKQSTEDRKEFLNNLTQTGEYVQHRDSVQPVKWIWRNHRPGIARSCIGLHPHCDIYIINNTPYRKHSKYHDYSTDDRITLYCLLLADGYMLNVKENSYQSNFNKIKERYFGENTTPDHEIREPLPDGIIKTPDDVITFVSDDIRHDVMYAFVTECLVEDSDLKFFLTTASRDVISEYCRSWGYERSETGRCLYIPERPLEMYELFIDKLQLDILPHRTVSDKGIHYSISARLGVPGEILNWDQEARERYVEYVKRGTQTVHHARGMIVGCAGAGKTTLLKRLLRCSDADIRGVTSTEGLEVHEEIFQICEETRTLKAKKTPGGDQKTLSVFDFAGQCPYYACHQIYLTRRAFYMLVVDASKYLDQVVDKSVCDQDGTVFSGWTYKDYFVFWIKSIHTYCGTEKEGEPDPEVTIVATHWDKNVYQNNKDSLLTTLQHLFSTNSTLGATYIREDNIFLTKLSEESPIETLSDLEKHIVEIVCQKRWAENIPKEWAFMEIEIPKTKSTIRIKSIHEIPIEVRQAQYDMLRYYHDAGKILYFNETGLQDLIIIDVQWFVDAFKNIITDKLHREGVKAIMNDWDEYYQTGHLKDSLLTEIWRKKDIELHQELLAKGRAAIEDDTSKDPRYLLPHKDEILRFMNRLGLIAVGGEYHYVPCMNRKNIDEKFAKTISGSKNKSSVLIFQFDFLPYFLFYQLVVSCMQLKNWKVLRDNRKLCLYKNAALFFSTDHHIAISVTETTVQLQVYLPGTDRTLDVKQTCDIQRVIEEKLHAITSLSRRGKGYIRGFICEKGIDQSTITANTECFISESEIKEIQGDKITCPLHGATDHHFIDKNELTKYWKTN
ncbi:uncharacterized protein LOC125673557 isoform X1 [Ostrea edulis]|uniref:uncharacterized protein LOC125673557 isoform X1 n=1 Tax=Ostrea edulis TaxID=37623 RepID=UPI0024AED3F0|nr:uncharacterized protein LOC125673557 isoform X1 [Ostrea edulis]